MSEMPFCLVQLSERKNQDILLDAFVMFISADRWPDRLTFIHKRPTNLSARISDWSTWGSREPAASCLLLGRSGSKRNPALRMCGAKKSRANKPIYYTCYRHSWRVFYVFRDKNLVHDTRANQAMALSVCIFIYKSLRINCYLSIARLATVDKYSRGSAAQCLPTYPQMKSIWWLVTQSPTGRETGTTLNDSSNTDSIQSRCFTRYYSIDSHRLNSRT